MIDAQTIAKINDAAKVEEVIGDFVSLKKRGANYFGLCPFHDEKTGSFSVSPAKGIFYCFGCGQKGNATTFVMNHEHLTYPDALRYLAKKYNIEITERRLSEEEINEQTNRDKMLNLNEFAADFFSKNLTQKEEGKAIGRSYFYERGFLDQTIENFRLGYSDRHSSLYAEATKIGYAQEHLLQTGLVYKKETDDTFVDRFRGRVIFPIHSISGRVVGFGGRILQKKDNVAKYLNSPESEIYNKSNELYGLFFAKGEIVKRDCCFLVEGYTDVISMSQSGIKNVVSSSGTSLTENQIRLLHRFTSNITIIYDRDPAGIKASLRGIDMLLQQGMNVKIVLLPDGDDPDSFAQKHNSVDFIDYINKSQIDFINFKIKILQDEAKNDPIKKASLISDVIRSITAIPDNIIRSQYVKEASTLLDIKEALIYSEINKINRTKKEEQFKAQNREDTRKNDNLPKRSLKSNKIDELEREIAGIIIRKGEVNLSEEEGKIFSVAQYLTQILKDAELELKNPFYKAILEDYLNNCNRSDFSCEPYFKNHENIDISNFATAVYAQIDAFTNIDSNKFVAEVVEIPDLDEDDPKSVSSYYFAIMQQNSQEKMAAESRKEIKKRIKATLNKILLSYAEEHYQKKKRSSIGKIKKQENNSTHDIIKEIEEVNSIIKEIANKNGKRAIAK